MTVWHDNT